MDLTALRENLRRVRTACGLSQSDVAERAGLSRLGYRNIEVGPTEPKVDTLIKVAAVLGVSLAELLRPVRPLQHVRFRAQKRMTSREELLADVARRLDDYANLERQLLEKSLIHPRLSPLVALREAYASSPSGNRARVAAARARELFAIDGNQIRDICGLLEDNGIKVITPALASEGFFGLSVREPERGDAIVVNTWDRLSVERWIFTAAHELAHLIFHLDAYAVSKTEEDKTEEQEADQFAAHFLMPEEIFRREWAESAGLPFLDRVLKVKRIFKVSWKTILYRIGEPLAADARRRLWMQFHREYERRTGKSLSGKEEIEGAAPGDFQEGRPAALVSQEPDHLLRSDFVEDRLYRLVRKAYEANEISLGRVAEILGIDIIEARDLSASWVE